MRFAQRGAAVVAAMLLAVLASAVAAGLLWQQQWNLKQHQHRREQAQAQALVVAGLQWAQQVLAEDARTSRVDHLGEAWAVRLPPTPVDNGDVSGYITDQQALFNVNNIVRGEQKSPRQLLALENVLIRAGGEAGLAEAILDWIDRDGKVSSEAGGEDAFYAASSPPRLAANRPLLRVAELGSVRGMRPAVLDALTPLVAALPEEVGVNVNTAPKAVLMAVIPDLDDEDAERILAERVARPFASVSDFRQRMLRPGQTVTDEMLDVGSRYFLVTVVARQGETRARGRALLRRPARSWPSVVWQLVE